MGKLLPFKRPKRRQTKRRWTQFSDYMASQPRMSRRARRSSTWGEAFAAMRPWLLLIALATMVVIWRTPELVGAPDLLATEPQRVEARFTRCTRGMSLHCVVDGDTVRIGSRSIRVMGFDAPEKDAQCPREERLAEAATQALQDWLNAGPFWMRGRWDEPTDRYGRELREFYRKDAGGRRVFVGDALVQAGLARRYYGGGRESWC